MLDVFKELKQQLWDATNYGLQFFEDEFTSEIARNRGSLKGFAVRTDDKTGSCHIHRKGENPYTFTDFGVSDKGINALDYVMNTRLFTAWQALVFLCQKYNVPIPDKHRKKPKAEIFTEPSQPVGHWSIEFYNELQSKGVLKQLFPFYSDVLLEAYGFKEIKNYSQIKEKDGKKYELVISSDVDTPLFGYDKGEFVKIYNYFGDKKDPKNLKHSFLGDKQGKRIIYGWENLISSVKVDRILELHETIKNIDVKEVKEEFQNELSRLQMDEVIIATGGTDGINIASLGYSVIWFNSEHELLNGEEYQILSKIAKKIYYVPDLDNTGVRQAVKLADMYLDIRILWLPQELKNTNKKDFADWLRANKGLGKEFLQNLFAKMLQRALNFRFWDYQKAGIQINPTKIIHFLRLKNFFSYKIPSVNNDYSKEEAGFFVQVQDNIIQKVELSDFRLFILHWIDEKFISMQVRNKFAMTTFFNATQLKLLPNFEYKKQSSGVDFQYYFFQNKIVKITANSIETQEYSKNTFPIWKEDINKRSFSLENPFFEVYNDDLGRKRIKILRLESCYFKVLINTSRIYWEKDANEAQEDQNIFQINSKNLTEEENYTQEIHLLNKMCCVGYLLHQYKVYSKSYLVMGVDYKSSGTSVKSSSGGTGKTFLLKNLDVLLNTWTTDGESFRNDNFPFDGLTPQTNLGIIDDLSFYQRMRPLFTPVTGNFIANQKGGVKYNIPLEQSPKLSATTNFVPKELTEPSAQRRLLIYHNSDYYHQQTNENEYLFTRKISDNFGGKDIMSENYPPELWNADINFMLQCLQLYLSLPEPIKAPMESLIERNYLLNIGDTFITFFTNFLQENNNIWIENSVFIQEAKETLGKMFVSAQDTKQRLLQYCKAQGWTLDEKKRKNNNNISVKHFIIYQNNEPATPNNNEPTPEPTAQTDNFWDIDSEF